jgi:dTDP-4-dehydrorhamnose reductase
VEKQIVEFCPDILVHLAAERRPDVVHNAPDDAQVLNVDVTRSVANACQKFGVWMIYISTDYVFDGTSPPYSVDAAPNPLSEYGKQKAAGENATLRECPRAAVLRVPLLYGQMEHLKESAVTALYPALTDGSMKSADHLQKRYPTYTQDLALVIEKMIETHSSGKDLQGIFHWQADECLTKFDMVQAIAEVQNLDASAIVADLVPPPFQRPEDSRLDCSRLVQELDIDPEAFRTPFRDALRTIFQQYAIDIRTASDGQIVKIQHASSACKLPVVWTTMYKDSGAVEDTSVEDRSNCTLQENENCIPVS